MLRLFYRGGIRKPPRNDIVLVTGAAIGFGQEIALLLAEEGFTVYAGISHAHQSDQLLAAAANRQVRLHPICLDTTNPNSIGTVVQTILAQDRAIFGVVHNDFHFLRSFFEDFTETEIRQMFEDALFGTMSITRALLPAMRTVGRGRVVIISSIAGRVATATGTAYSSMRFAQEGFAEALAQEVKPFGIYVSLIEAGITPAESWTTEKSAGTNARNPNSPYYQRFQQADQLFTQALDNSHITHHQIAQKVCHAMTSPQPPLRYIIGRKAQTMIYLRRYLPAQLFEWLLHHVAP